MPLRACKATLRDAVGSLRGYYLRAIMRIGWIAIALLTYVSLRTITQQSMQESDAKQAQHHSHLHMVSGLGGGVKNTSTGTSPSYTTTRSRMSHTIQICSHMSHAIMNICSPLTHLTQESTRHAQNNKASQNAQNVALVTTKRLLCALCWIGAVCVFYSRPPQAPRGLYACRECRYGAYLGGISVADF